MAPVLSHKVTAKKSSPCRVCLIAESALQVVYPAAILALIVNQLKGEQVRPTRHDCGEQFLQIALKLESLRSQLSG